MAPTLQMWLLLCCAQTVSPHKDSVSVWHTKKTKSLSFRSPELILTRWLPYFSHVKQHPIKHQKVRVTDHAILLSFLIIAHSMRIFMDVNQPKT